MICADTHPDPDTICTFRGENAALIRESFGKVLEMAARLKFLKGGQITVAVDGTKVLANASKHSADGTPTGIEVLAAVEKTSHHRTVQDLEQQAGPVAPGPGASVMEVMRYRLKTPAGRAKYRLRQQTAEPVFGMIKSAMGFRRFLLRGLAKVRLEWTRVSTAYNLKRLHRMATAVG